MSGATIDRGRRALGGVAVAAALLLTAAVLVPVWLILRFGATALVATWGWVAGDPTWNDGDAAIGLGLGGVGLLVVVGLAALAGVLIARWAGFRRRRVAGGLALAAVLALGVAALPGW